jgi:hypothetical protein
MRERSLRLALIACLTIVSATACKKEEEQPPPNQAGLVQQPGYQQQPVAAQPVAAQPVAAQPVAAQPAAASPTPSPLATVCKSDAECIGAKCNVAAGKCQFPCGSNNDCQAGWSCALQMGSVCMPAPNTIQQPAK